MGPSEETTTELKPHAAASSVLQIAEPKKPNSPTMHVCASDKTPDLDTYNTVKIDGSMSTKAVERTPFNHGYYLSKIGLSPDLVPAELYQECKSILQKSGFEKSSSLVCSKSLQSDKGVTKRGSNDILKHIFPAASDTLFQKAVSFYAATTGKSTMLN